MNYPVVLGFERFYSGLDSEERLAEGGLLLLNELNCVACHAPPKAWADQLSGSPGSNLEGVGDRYRHLDLELMIRSPRLLKRDTLMPSLFSGPDRDLVEIEDLKHYLASLKRPDPYPKRPEGDIDRGRTFYHQVGCVSCHAPEADYRPPHLSPETELDHTGLPHVPMNLADVYSEEALVEFLLDPNHHRPSMRMPEFDLSAQEAADLAAYLKAGPGLTISSGLSQALVAMRVFEPDPVRAKRGEAVFAKKRCYSCHEMEGAFAESRPVSAPLANLAERAAARFPEGLTEEANFGCLSARALEGGVPYYGLDAVQVRAILAALQKLHPDAPKRTAHQTSEARLDWEWQRLNCYACHEVDGKGGVEYGRDIFFTSKNPDSLTFGRNGFLPPNIAPYEKQLTVEWIRSKLGHGAPPMKARPYLRARMPQYHPHATAEMVAVWEKILPKSGARPSAFGQKEIKQFLKSPQDWISAQGADCATCHGATDETPPAAVRLDAAPHRLRVDFLEAFLNDPVGSHREIGIDLEAPDP